MKEPDEAAKKVSGQDASSLEVAQETAILLDEISQWSPSDPVFRTLDCWWRGAFLFLGGALIQAALATWVWGPLVILGTLPLVMEATARSLTGRPRLVLSEVPSRMFSGAVGIAYVSACLFLWTVIATMVLWLPFVLVEKFLGGAALAMLVCVPPGLYFLKIYTAMLLGFPATSLFGGEDAYRNAFRLVEEEGWQRLLFALPFFLWFGVTAVAASWIPSIPISNLVFFLGLDLFVSVWTFRYLFELQRWRITTRNTASFPGNARLQAMLAADGEASE